MERIGIRGEKPGSADGSLLGRVTLDVATFGLCLGYIGALSRSLGPGQVGVILFVLAGAEVFARLITAGSFRSSQTPSSQQADPAHLFYNGLVGLLTRALIWGAGFLILTKFVPFAALSNAPFAVVSLPALGFLLGLMRLGVSVRSFTGVTAKQTRWPTPVRWLLALSFSVGAAEYWQADPRDILALNILAAVAVLVLLLRTLPFPAEGRVVDRDSTGRSGGALCDIGRVLLRWSDVLAAGWFLAPEDAAVYLVVRCLVMPMDIVFCAVRAMTLPALEDILSSDGRLAFRSAAARVNLGHLLMGASTAMALLSCGTWAFGLVTQLTTQVSALVLWLVLARGAASIFGAVDDMLAITRNHGIQAQLAWAFAVISGLLYSYVGRFDPVMLSKCYALCQLAHAASGAAIVSRTLGVWPGLTALLHKQLKLL